jgi:hypothetical protein
MARKQRKLIRDFSRVCLGKIPFLSNTFFNSENYIEKWLEHKDFVDSEKQPAFV